MNDKSAVHIHITGVVQGVGFRPFVYGLAKRLGLTGWVKNTSAGVEIEASGQRQDVDVFVNSLRVEAPPLARIDEIHVQESAVNGYTDFTIIASQPIPDAFQPISPDVSVCQDCLDELFDPNDRRYRYPFINCTNCGPRFTIITDIPYDRPNTTMAGFEMCPQCAAEYRDPSNRRFHAQPTACPECGPTVWLEPSLPEAVSEQPILARTEAALRTVRRMLLEGKTVAIKGLGGFHLACDATNPQAVARLRSRKLRVDKPFALMMPDIDTIAANCYLDEQERQLLESSERPIVVLRRRPESRVASAVAPEQNTLGVMLPYTPLHYLLFSPENSSERTPAKVLVMTSGNLSEEPIAIDNQEARQRLSRLADAFLMHNRPIHTRCDDSVMRLQQPYPPASAPKKDKDTHNTSTLVPLRRSRGYAPYPVLLAWEAPPVLAVGPELKNTFAITHGRYAFLSHHIGDMENYETLQSFESGITHFERLFRVRPQLLAYDLHPNYLASRYAQQRAERAGLPAVGVQHHHAHIAACMAENGILEDQQVIGVAFDGTGYGSDGAIWGGEFLLASYREFKRVAHLAYVPLPGGDAAIRKPARTALAYLWKAGLSWDADLPSVAALDSDERVVLLNQLQRGINAPLTSSMGRLFDAVASLAGVRQQVNYEAQAAVEFEALVDADENRYYPFDLVPDKDESLRIDAAALIWLLVSDFYAGLQTSIIAARFHNGVAQMVLEVCRKLRAQSALNVVALSGGVWQNVTLLAKTLSLLENDGFQVLTHHKVPANDGGLALGQAAVAYWKQGITRPDRFF
jgi:hydrogenase maturation protein HypF